MRGNPALDALYGKPYNPDGTLNAAWQAENIVDLIPPYPMFLAWAPAHPVARIRVHKTVKDSLSAVLTQIYNEARLRVKQRDGFSKTTEYYDAKTLELLASEGLDQYGGAFEFRVQRGSDKISDHAYGAAIDLDPAHNPFRSQSGRMPNWAVAIFKANGWTWGGNFSPERRDPMHFQKP